MCKTVGLELLRAIQVSKFSMKGMFFTLIVPAKNCAPNYR